MDASAAAASSSSSSPPPSSPSRTRKRGDLPAAADDESGVTKKPCTDEKEESAVASNEVACRFSWTGPLQFDKTTGLPIHPGGVTNSSADSKLFYDGPNHAADACVVAFPRFIDCKDLWTHEELAANPGVFRVLLITRKDNGKLAFPGGFCEHGEFGVETAIRELKEEAFGALEGLDGELKQQLRAARRKHSPLTDFELIKSLRSNEFVIHKGPIGDPRDSRHKWIETLAVALYADTWTFTHRMKLLAGDDAASVGWYTIKDCLEMPPGSFHAQHRRLVEQCAILIRSGWAREAIKNDLSDMDTRTYFPTANE